MSNKTIPIFVVGSGRSGTRTIYKLLSGESNVEIYHEFVCTHIQQVACLYYMGIFSEDDVRNKIKTLHGSSIFYSKKEYWIDCSNKLSWIIKPLYDLFPNAKFIHLVRDGRKVASSYYHKLNDEMYDDESTRILYEWLHNREKVPIPPPEKKYWWNIPQEGQPYYNEFRNFDQFQRACYQWNESNRIILESLKRLPKDQKYFVKLEELVNDKNVLNNFLSFVGVEYKDQYYNFLQTPQNVIYPMDFQLTPNQKIQFESIAGEMMKILGYYSSPEYIVKY